MGFVGYSVRGDIVRVVSYLAGTAMDLADHQILSNRTLSASIAFNEASKNVAENVPLLILFAMLASVSLRPCFASRSATHHIGHRPCGYDYDSEK